MLQAALFLKAQALPRTPILTGHLRGSAFTDSGEAVSRLGERVFDVVITGSTILVAAGDGNLHRSTNAYAWQNLTGLVPHDWGDEVNDQGWTAAVDPTDGDHIVFSLHDTWHPADASTGVYESTDRGSTWAPSNEGLAVRDATALAFASDGTLYAGTWCGGIWRRPIQ